MFVFIIVLSVVMCFSIYPAMIAQCQTCGGFVATDHEFLGNLRDCLCIEPVLGPGSYVDKCRPTENLFLSHDALTRNYEVKKL